MPTVRGEQVLFVRKKGARLAALFLGGALCQGAAHAGELELWDDATLDYKLTVSYAAAIRTKNPNDALINGPVDQFQSYLFPVQQPNQPAQIFSFTHTGLPTTANYDDADRNFKAGSLINNRATGLGELQFHWKNYGIVASGDGFFDQVYHHPNDNDSPSTVNTTLPNSHWTDGARYYDGQRVRLLDAYAYGDFSFFDMNLNVRAGQQLVAYGQSLFLSGIALAQSRADATKSVIPGAEVKSILLPTNQISFRLGINNELSMVGYYKLAFRATEIFPEGDFFSPADAVGPGATFVYGSANPLYGGPGECSGLLTNFHIGNTPAPLTPALENLVCTLLFPVGQLLNAPKTINATRGPDIKPSDFGQYGGGLEYQLTSRTNVAFYYLRYDDTNPSVNLNVGYAPFGFNPITGAPVTTQIINQPVPNTYNVKYFDGIHLYGGTFSTVLGPFNVAGEVNFRDGTDLPIDSTISGVVSPVYTRGQTTQALLSAIYVNNPKFFFDDLAVTAEAGYLHVNDVDPVASSPGIITHGNGDVLFYNRNSWGFQTLTIPTKHNIFNGWDMSTPISFGMLVKGTPEQAGAFGALYGEGDTRLGVSLNFQYLGNLEVGVGYNFFFGDPNKTIGDSLLKANPYMDRDYATFHITYNL
ncbi:DUF1302 domain-containing protein [Nevskia soli]|uniref:DUF1302 domain-containing protein n=1 Tax=Nevskia soli TaxID=418856 RepID=UPI0009FC5FD7|nr:DUF1302 family protein [Nevskia soli]